jgi:hypothetical protein
MNTHYVHMTDNFLSGWGDAENKINKFVIECSNRAQAEQIATHARTRSEMRRVKITLERPTFYPRSRYLVSTKTYADLGGCWIADGGRIADGFGGDK